MLLLTRYYGIDDDPTVVLTDFPICCLPDCWHGRWRPCVDGIYSSIIPRTVRDWWPALHCCCACSHYSIRWLIHFPFSWLTVTFDICHSLHLTVLLHYLLIQWWCYIWYSGVVDLILHPSAQWQYVGNGNVTWLAVSQPVWPRRKWPLADQIRGGQLTLTAAKHSWPMTRSVLAWWPAANIMA